MTKPVYTPYFAPDAIPSRDGIYQRRRKEWRFLQENPLVTIVRFHKWANGQWHCEGRTPEAAAKQTEPSAYQRLEWRGRLEQAA